MALRLHTLKWRRQYWCRHLSMVFVGSGIKYGFRGPAQIHQNLKKLELIINSMRRTRFTLVEIIIYLAIVGSIAVSLVLYTLSLTTFRAKISTASEVQENARFALDVIAQKIRS